MSEAEQGAGRVVIVTGGTRGMGRETAGYLARNGYRVVVNYAGNEAQANETVEEITAGGGTVVAKRADVADEVAVSAMFDEVEAEFGGVDVVVHAAGVMPVGPMVDFDLAQLDRLLNVNIRGTYVVNQQAAKRLRSGGAIINFSSSITRFSRPGYTAYAATKGAVQAMALILARELRGRDITVNVVAPGPIATPLFFEGKSQEVIDRISAEPPLGRLGEPDDVSGTVAFLAGPGRWINGQTLFINGGAI
ncbi:SDR family oxidoreductase [Actinacidiphila glaucinigra]|uniref:3-oxoacyl-[acyl-carrier protein] reductase n=1 Tax=Actinacidiphila glaucinigra TaxID=235986 RepID=A0A239NI47_9ACTN|nr:SDR family oxidoreductase [Actinacidiphila glaucinigra]SNT54084.1 3-oxoacyl-[acyl-carrier protein] reductase [Actinacidiphila glaucinigra]